ncbi:hypothetical protein PLESTF_000104300 [Pleodorina starrii]|nr:hypothetical protein PLESTM_001270200 [Pleodorina starrii]GLC63971.1 hypothetical protein PLESTF_000104300 [Pleodorina starrii]
MLRKSLARCLAPCASTPKACAWTNSAIIKQDETDTACGSSSQGCSGPNLKPASTLDANAGAERRGVLFPWLQRAANHHRQLAAGMRASLGLNPSPLGLAHTVGALSHRCGVVAPSLGAHAPCSLLPSVSVQSVQCITTKTWRRLKIKKHKIRKRRRLNRKAAK